MRPHTILPDSFRHHLAHNLARPSGPGWRDRSGTRAGAELHGQQGEIVRAILSLGVNEAGIVTELAKMRAAVDTIAQAQDDQADAAYDGELDRLIARSSHGH